MIERLASSQNRRDEGPNIELAEEIVTTKNKAGVVELVKALNDKNSRVQNDCIKVLYEIGNRNPALIQGHFDLFVSKLSSKNNRVQWGAMTAISSLAELCERDVAEHLEAIVASGKRGSVITRDQTVKILLSLYNRNHYKPLAWPAILDLCESSAENQFPAYSEQVSAVISQEHLSEFVALLTSRIPSIQKESRKKRIERVLKKLSNRLKKDQL